MREVSIAVENVPAGVYRIASVGALAAEWEGRLRFLVLASDAEAGAVVQRWRAGGLQNVAPVDGAGLEEGDIVALRPEHGRATVLYRESDVHHTLFVTNRCNSYCLMCSQPPTRHDDSWLMNRRLRSCGTCAMRQRSLAYPAGNRYLQRMA